MRLRSKVIAWLFPVRPGTRKVRGWIQLGLVVIVLGALAFVLVTQGVTGPTWVNVAFVLVMAAGLTISSIRIIRLGEARS